MDISSNQKRFLKGLAHNLNPVVRISAQGLTDNILTELKTQLDHHELIKISIKAGDRNLRKQIAFEIIEQMQAELIMATGNIIAIYKPSQNPKKQKAKIILPEN